MKHTEKDQRFDGRRTRDLTQDQYNLVAEFARNGFTCDATARVLGVHPGAVHYIWKCETVSPRVYRRIRNTQARERVKQIKLPYIRIRKAG